MTLLSALKLYAGGDVACQNCGRHEAYGQFLPTSKKRRITVPDKKGADIKAFSAPLNNATLMRYTSAANALLYIEHVNGRRAWSVLLSRQNGASKEIERMVGSVKDVRSHVTTRFGVKFDA